MPCKLFVALQEPQQPYRLWSAQAARLAAPGDLTFDDAGVRRDMPGVVGARFPSRVEATVMARQVAGCNSAVTRG
ncbi:MAG: hypothetical protein ABJA34_03330 [Pseudonocardiales bacterium]